MMKYKVCELFDSIQGEGLYSGTKSVFIRLSGCNLACSFCDEPLHKGDKYTEYKTKDLVQEILEKWGYQRHFVITGGEPTLQNLKDLISELNKFYPKSIIQIETNGYDIAKYVDCKNIYVTWSPKQYDIEFLKEVMKALILGKAKWEVKLPYSEYKEFKNNKQIFEDVYQELSVFIIDAPTLYLTPINNEKRLNLRNVNDTINELNRVNLIPWRLNTQIHKILGLQ